MAKSNSATVSPDLQAQREYVRKTEQRGFDFGLTVADAFVRGIRDVGYKSTSTALNEIVDNAIQAEADSIHVVFGFPEGSSSKPESIAVIDSGHGMDPEMLRLSVIWGGTHRENNRHGFGRFGYGLPSASVSQGQRFTVFSTVEGGVLHGVTLDLEEISAGKYDRDGRIVVPEATPAEMPGWLSEYISLQSTSFPNGLVHGTIVLIEKLDRHDWKTAVALQTNLIQDFGVTYRNFLRSTSLLVQGKRVEPVDPLFITPGMRFYDLDEDRAEALPPMSIAVKSDRGEVGNINLRFSYMPPTFARIDKTKDAGAKNANGRFPVMKENNGLIVCRNGRQIDVVTQGLWTHVQNNDRYWGLELDFPPILDELFSVTTTKQQIKLTERMNDILLKENVDKVVEDLRNRYKRDHGSQEAKSDATGKRASEAAMEEAEKFVPTKTPSIERAKRSDDKLRQEILRTAEKLGLPLEQIGPSIEQEKAERPYKVLEAFHPGAPFFRVDQIGGQKILELNTAHRFYTDVYGAPDSTPRLRAAIEVLLFVIGECEHDSTGDRHLFYETERAEWSGRLNIALERLGLIRNVADFQSESGAVAGGPAST